MGKAGAQSGAFAPIAAMADHLDPAGLETRLRACMLPALQIVRRAIGASIIDDDDLFLDRHSLNAPQQFTNPFALVINGNDDGKLEMFGNRINAELPARAIAEPLLENINAIV